MGGFRVDFEWVWGGLELICARCAAGLAAALELLWGVVNRVLVTPKTRPQDPPS